MLYIGAVFMLYSSLQVFHVGLELPEVQFLRSRLATGRELQTRIAAVLAATGEDRCDIPALRALQQHAASCGLALSGADMPFSSFSEMSEVIAFGMLYKPKVLQTLHDVLEDYTLKKRLVVAVLLSSIISVRLRYEH